LGVPFHTEPPGYLFVGQVDPERKKDGKGTRLHAKNKKGAIRNSKRLSEGTGSKRQDFPSSLSDTGKKKAGGFSFQSAKGWGGVALGRNEGPAGPLGPNQRRII